MFILTKRMKRKIGVCIYTVIGYIIQLQQGEKQAVLKFIILIIILLLLLRTPSKDFKLYIVEIPFQVLP